MNPFVLYQRIPITEPFIRRMIMKKQAFRPGVGNHCAPKSGNFFGTDLVAKKYNPYFQLITIHFITINFVCGHFTNVVIFFILPHSSPQKNKKQKTSFR
jgi:hypothetical protein